MNRLLPGALALGCALALGACNASDLSAVSGVAPNLPPSATVSHVLAGAGVSAAGQAKANATIAAVQRAAVALCQIRPLASGILNIGIALSPSLSTISSSGLSERVGGVATIACNALDAAPTYTSTGQGQMVRGIAHLPNGIDVPVYGVRLR
jgi:hypothetical protein